MGNRLQVGTRLAEVKGRGELFQGIVVSGISDHQGFLHGPGIVAGNETDQPFLTVARSYWVFAVHGFAFNKETILVIENRQVVSFQVEENIRHFIRVFLVNVGDLWSPTHFAE